MTKFGRRRVLAAGAALAVSQSAGAEAQADYPDHAIRFVGGFPPGGPADLSRRMLAQSLSDIQMAGSCGIPTAPCDAPLC